MDGEDRFLQQWVLSGTFKSTDLWLCFPSQSSLLYLLPLLFEANCDCVFAQYVVQMISEATKVKERVEMCLMMAVRWRSTEHAFEGYFLILKWNSQGGKKKSAVFHAGHLFTLWLIKVNVWFCMAFCLFVFNLLNIFTKNKKKLLRGLDPCLTRCYYPCPGVTSNFLSTFLL